MLLFVCPHRNSRDFSFFSTFMFIFLIFHSRFATSLFFESNLFKSIHCCFQFSPFISLFTVLFSKFIQFFSSSNVLPSYFTHVSMIFLDHFWFFISWILIDFGIRKVTKIILNSQFSFPLLLFSFGSITFTTNSITFIQLLSFDTTKFYTLCTLHRILTFPKQEIETFQFSISFFFGGEKNKTNL